jgi:hypothetical protein
MRGLIIQVLMEKCRGIGQASDAVHELGAKYYRALPFLNVVMFQGKLARRK